MVILSGGRLWHSGLVKSLWSRWGEGGRFFHLQPAYGFWERWPCSMNCWHSVMSSFKGRSFHDLPKSHYEYQRDAMRAYYDELSINKGKLCQLDIIFLTKCWILCIQDLVKFKNMGKIEKKVSSFKTPKYCHILCVSISTPIITTCHQCFVIPHYRQKLQVCKCWM